MLQSIVRLAANTANVQVAVSNAATNWNAATTDSGPVLDVPTSIPYNIVYTTDVSSADIVISSSATYGTPNGGAADNSIGTYPNRIRLLDALASKDPKVLTPVFQHEIGHSLRLANAGSCTAGQSVMTGYSTDSSGNFKTQITLEIQSSDVSQVIFAAQSASTSCGVSWWSPSGDSEGGESACADDPPNDSCVCDDDGSWDCECTGNAPYCDDGEEAVCGDDGNWTCSVPCNDECDPECSNYDPSDCDGGCTADTSGDSSGCGGYGCSGGYGDGGCSCDVSTDCTFAAPAKPLPIAKSSLALEIAGIFLLPVAFRIRRIKASTN
jgi:hypothetical protein